MYKAVLFDLDGTLLNRDESVKRFVDHQYERLNKVLCHIPKEQYITRFIELDERGYVWKDKVYQELVKEFEIKGLPWEYLLEDYIREFKHYCVPFPNLIGMLDELKRNNIRLGMITNGKRQFQMDNIQALGIEAYFDVILVSETEGIKKPAPQIFHRALEKLNVASINSVYIGDHPDNDIQGAQNAGMKAIWKKAPQWTNVKADYIVNDLSELVEILNL
ncbi:HAD family hydrolase [Halalkalibacter urbisdiaboli]|uniref:HAD family hydrolase n=1 Tax=Halalkalibacter urbisdiaboli TaxID=1960589 RepID=UPI000B43F20E|nr:HAD family hydrolase [Halalkalibacter urbisdiaboli]